MLKIINILHQNNLILRFIKFSLIGISGILVNSFFLWILYDHAELEIYFASPIAIVIAIFNNFNWNDRFTWNENRENRSSTYGKRLLKYYFSSIIGALISYLILLILTLEFNWHYLLGNIAGILIGTVSNFLLGNFWVFKNKIATDLKMSDNKVE